MLPPPKNLTDAYTAPTMPTAIWVAVFIDRVKLLLSVDGQDGDVDSFEWNLLQWYFAGYEIEKKIVAQSVMRKRAMFWILRLCCTA